MVESLLIAESRRAQHGWISWSSWQRRQRCHGLPQRQLAHGLALGIPASAHGKMKEAAGDQPNGLMVDSRSLAAFDCNG
jgi:hypothetical protein